MKSTLVKKVNKYLDIAVKSGNNRFMVKNLNSLEVIEVIQYLEDLGYKVLYDNSCFTIKHTFNTD